MKFDIKLERDVLQSCQQDRLFMDDASRMLETAHFTNKYNSWIYSVLLGNWRRCRELTTTRMLVISARKQFTTKDKRSPYIEAIGELDDHKPSGSPKLSLDELVDYVDGQALKGAMESSLERMQKGQVSDAWKVIDAASAVRARRKPWDRGYWSEEFEERQSTRRRLSRPGNNIIVPTGIRRLDDSIDGGMYKPSFGIIAGTTGRGKSVVAINVAYYGALRGHYVVLCGTEMTRMQMETRVDALSSRTPYSKFKRYSFSNDEVKHLRRLMKRRRRVFGKRLEIVSFPLLSCDVNWIRQLVERRSIEGVPTDMIIVDSGDHLNPVSQNRNDPHWVRVARPYWEMKAFSDEGYVLWTTGQLSKEMVDKLASGEGLSGSYDKARVAEVIITLNQTRKQKHLGEMDVYLAKARDSVDRKIIPISTNFEIMLAEDDMGRKSKDFVDTDDDPGDSKRSLNSHPKNK